jgi:type I restriction enzyme S subunit
MKRELIRTRLNAAVLHGINNGNGKSDTPLNFKESARFFFNHLPKLTTRPEHIEELRKTILNQAVRGRLVKQKMEDGQAINLLNAIAEDKQRLVSDGRYKGRIEVRPVELADAPYQLPDNWEWASFGSITICRDGERIPVSKEERSRREKIYDYYGASGIIDKIDDYLFDKPLLLIGEDGANLVNRSTPIAFIARGKYWVNNHAHVIDGISEEFLKYLAIHINAIDLKPYLTGAAQPKLNQRKMNSIPIAVPPISEQEKIVSKVEELMYLCDALETSIKNAKHTGERLLLSTLQQALEKS